MTNEDLTTIANVGPEKADRLREAGFETVDDPRLQPPSPRSTSPPKPRVSAPSVDL